jgi:ubiquinone biosynthesis monooxygenase Coq7
MNAINLDTLLTTVDRALKAVLVTPVASRPTPKPSSTGADQPRATEGLSDTARRESARLMRVNHAGEVAAQGLYHGQALFAKNPETQQLLNQAAREEADHLAWCAERLEQLGSRPSLLSPLWYAGSFAIGAAAALGGDKLSLGFVTETEQQVEGHIDSHLERLPPDDQESRAILEVMRADEIAHGSAARAAGGVDLPAPVQSVMRATARIMTETSYRL